jgi:hypothetical protein
MQRVRISTTVDAGRLQTARRLLNQPDSRIIDRALAALIDELEAQRELAALEAHPYERDPDLAWRVPVGPDLPYEGDIPPDVLEMAAHRRRTR